MDNKIDKLKERYSKLLAILEKYGPVEMSTQIRTIKEILIYLDTANESDDVMIKQVFQMHKSMSPGKSGLAEFHFWDNDFETRSRVNKPLGELKQEIWDILVSDE
ncbi:hypothetical protein HCA78_11875 [Listeria booriae]|uniref:Uncharacterized protein n=1 Tax=Listeria booriae TaxID=1552123 RepID=A0A841W608_9LIST|nr:hypothetical protein [Listeria booriae]MBC1209449.1 hypothetical protein [Listeria booriae]MBC1229834.1 hypothetical protein [Listeria booriae]MBC2004471.1 hypothetical protein [Listeria booriae]MBC2158765.1 hypothetical protein [Listeria booriae]